MPTKSLFTPVMGGGAEPAVGMIADVPGSAQFNGANSLDSPSAALKWDGLTTFTIALWWFSGPLPAANQIAYIFSQSDDPNTHTGYALRVNGSTQFLNWEVAENPGSGNNPARVVPNLGITANTWYLIIPKIIAGGAFSAIDVFRSPDGTHSGSSVGWTTPGGVAASNLTLGAGPVGANSDQGLNSINTSGRIDSFARWTRNLTAAEYTILQNVVAGAPTGVDWSQIANTSLNDAQVFLNLDGLPNGNTDGRDSSPNGRNFTNHADPFGVFVTRGPEKP